MSMERVPLIDQLSQAWGRDVTHDEVIVSMGWDEAEERYYRKENGLPYLIPELPYADAPCKVEVPGIPKEALGVIVMPTLRDEKLE